MPRIMVNDFCKRTKNKDLFYLSFSPSPLFFHTILIIHISFMLQKNKEKKIREGEQEGNNLLLAGRCHGLLPSPPLSPLLLSPPSSQGKEFRSNYRNRWGDHRYRGSRGRAKYTANLRGKPRQYSRIGARGGGSRSCYAKSFLPRPRF